MYAEILMILKGYAFLFMLQTILWLRQTQTKNASTADIGWSVGMAFIVGWYAFHLNGYWLREAVLFSMILIWSVRLSSHLMFRTMHEKKEDSRYARLRELWGDDAVRNYFIVYQLQPVFNLILSVPFYFIFVNSSPNMGLIEYIGAAIWLTGLFGESVADKQLSHFKNDPENKGKICQEGLWAYSRHPNFFFEWVIWIGYAVVALGSPYGVYGLIAPAFMLFLLMKVTGIPIIEKHALQKKGEAFRQYMNSTSFFIPMPRKE